MKIKHIKIEVDTQTINPTLNCQFRMEFDYLIEIPISVSGRLLNQDGKVLSLINEHQINTNNIYELGFVTEIEKKKFSNSKSSHFFQLSAELSQLAIESIERQREKNSDKSIKLSIDLVVKSIELDNVNNKNNDYIRFRIERKYETVFIEQSAWVNNFSHKLGIGKFMLVELNVPDNEIPTFWSDLFEKLRKNVDDMEKSIKSGDWQKTLFFARKFFENIKFGDNKKGHKKFKEEFNLKMKKLQYSEEAVTNLYDAIWKFFEFLSKFIHDKDKNGNSYEVLPIPNKEDAYFAYALSIGLLGLIGRKINE